MVGQVGTCIACFSSKTASFTISSNGLIRGDGLYSAFLAALRPAASIFSAVATSLARCASSGLSELKNPFFVGFGGLRGFAGFGGFGGFAGLGMATFCGPLWRTAMNSEGCGLRLRCRRPDRASHF